MLPSRFPVVLALALPCAALAAPLGDTPGWEAISPIGCDDTSYTGTGGDINADGIDDYIVSFGHTEACPDFTLHIWYGVAGGAFPADPDVYVPGATHTEDYIFGRASTMAADVDGDGYNDLVVGSNWYDEPSSVSVFRGGPDGPAATADTVISHDGGFFGEVLATADFDQDGFDDVAVGADQEGSLAGAVFVYMGSSAGLLTAEAATYRGRPNTNYGVSVATGDVNGDGYPDLLMGSLWASGGDGEAYLAYGSAAGLPAASDLTIPAVDRLDAFGSSLALGDVNGDGFDDAVICAYATNSYRGRAFLYMGSAAGLSTSPAQIIDGPGTNLSHFGDEVVMSDFDQDGHADVAIGADGDGELDVLPGRVWGLDVASMQRIRVADYWFTVEISAAGDIDADGYPDLAATGYHSAYAFFGEPSILSDDDGDGADPSTDCDDTDASIGPLAVEIVADGVDEDCDGVETCYVDADADGYRPDDRTAIGGDRDCDDPGEATADLPLADCDDADPTIRPGATDPPDDGIDQDCDGSDPSTGDDTGLADTDVPDDTGGHDTAEREDTGEHAAPAKAEAAAAGGCGCAQGSAMPGGWLLGMVAGLVGGRRRR